MDESRGGRGIKFIPDSRVKRLGSTTFFRALTYSFFLRYLIQILAVGVFGGVVGEFVLFMSALKQLAGQMEQLQQLGEYISQKENVRFMQLGSLFTEIDWAGLAGWPLRQQIADPGGRIERISEFKYIVGLSSSLNFGLQWEGIFSPAAPERQTNSRNNDSFLLTNNLADSPV